MKVVVRSSSLFFTLLSIVLHVPITRVKRNGVSEPAPPIGKQTASAAPYSVPNFLRAVLGLRGRHSQDDLV